MWYIISGIKDKMNSANTIANCLTVLFSLKANAKKNKPCSANNSGRTRYENEAATKKSVNALVMNKNISNDAYKNTKEDSYSLAELSITPKHVIHTETDIKKYRNVFRLVNESMTS